MKQPVSAVGSENSLREGGCSCLQRPALFAEGLFPAGLLPATVDFALPTPVLAQSELSVAGVVEVDLRDLGLDKCPYAPVCVWRCQWCVVGGLEV